MPAPGQDYGHASLDWAAYLEALIADRGSLSAVAAHVGAQRGYTDDVASIERGLRRLRGRGHRDGGVWGRRVLAIFGLPGSVVDRVRWMGLYHSRFTDLPTSICRELLVSWNRPPVSETPARVWVQLGLASVALRQRRYDQAAMHLTQAERTPGPPAAKVELALSQSYLLSRTDSTASERLLDTAETLLANHDETATWKSDGTTAGERDETIHGDDYACLYARLIDQRAYHLNKPREGNADHAAAFALYRRIPQEGPPFARCRRHNGMGWSLLRLGHPAEALAHARHSVREAGDSGSLRMRAMALNLLARALATGPDADPDAATHAAQRAAAIARRLEDEELIGRYGG